MGSPPCRLIRRCFSRSISRAAVRATDLWLGEHGVAATIGEATGTDAATVRERAVAGIATGRFSTAEEVATRVALLASPRTANVTGSNYIIDGGLVKTM
jgi:NAD(P)-dependent dehydrogenase (short-subunit alcohol dehydrogenase family)